jgi:hypothetical protein
MKKASDNNFKKSIVYGLLTITLAILLLVGGFLYWKSNWSRYVSEDGFSLSAPSFVIVMKTDGPVLGEDERKEVAQIIFRKDSNYFNTNATIIFHYPKSKFSGSGVEKLASDAESIRKELPAETKDLRRYSTRFGNIPVEVVSFMNISPDNGQSFNETQYFIEGEKYYYQIDSSLYLEGMSLIQQRLNIFLYDNIIRTFKTD